MISSSYYTTLFIFYYDAQLGQNIITLEPLLAGNKGNK